MSKTETETEGAKSPCKCNVDLVEGSLTINGKRVRFFRCQKCNMFMYLQSDLQKAVYGRAPLVEDPNWEEKAAN